MRHHARHCAASETDRQSVALATETFDATRAFVALVFLGSNRGSVWGYVGVRQRFWLATVEHLQAQRVKALPDQREGCSKAAQVVVAGSGARSCTHKRIGFKKATVDLRRSLSRFRRGSLICR